MLVGWPVIFIPMGVLFFIGLNHFLRHVSRQRAIKRWQLSLQIPQHLKYFNTIYYQTNGFLLSQLARQTYQGFEYTYGEIDFQSFIALLGLTAPHQQTRFYDLGCGVGKAVIACAMVFDVEYACGIEILAPLYEAAEQAKQNVSVIPHYASLINRIHFIQNNFLQVDLQLATLIFINAAGFIGAFWQAICEKLIKNAKNATIIVVSKTLPDTHFLLQKQTWVTMSWGVVKASIYTVL